MMASNDSSLLSLGCNHYSFMTVNTAVSYLYFLMFPVSLLLNGLAAWVSLHVHSTSTFIIYVKNLVAADLLMTLTLPPMAASMLPQASVGVQAFVCRYSGVVFFCCLYTSISLMGLISLDRFFKIVRPRGQALGQSLNFSIGMSALVWVMLFGCTAFPTMILTDQDPGNRTHHFCLSLKSSAGVFLQAYVVLFMDILFWCVCVLIVFCYICITIKVLQSFKNSGSSNSHGKKEIKLRVFLILLVFFVCFVPFHILRVPYTLHETTGVCSESWLVIVHNVFLWVSTTNACLDPLLYMYLCREFKDKLVNMMRARGVCVHLYSGETEETSQ